MANANMTVKLDVTDLESVLTGIAQELKQAVRNESMRLKGEEHGLALGAAITACAAAGSSRKVSRRSLLTLGRGR